MTDLFRDDVSMLVHELLLAHMLAGKIFNLITLQTRYFFCTQPNTNCLYLCSTLIVEIKLGRSTLAGQLQANKKNRTK